MKITIESTTKIVTLEAADSCQVQARVWQGHTDSGIPVQVFVTRIAPELPDTHPHIEVFTADFERELRRCADPRPSVEAIPLRLII